MANSGVKRGIGMTGPFPNIPGVAGATLLKAPSREGGIIWGGTPLVDAVAEFGVDNTGSVADNSTRLNNALVAAAQGGYGLYLPPPAPNIPAVVKIQNPIVMGNGTSTALSTVQGVRLVGAGWPGNSHMDTSTFVYGMCEILWNGASGGTMFQLLGPLQGWGLENLYFYAGATNRAATGLSILSGQFGLVQNVNVDNCSSAQISESVNWSSSVVGNSMHNTWRKIGLYVPNGTFGWQFGGSGSADTCYEHVDDLSIVMAQPSTTAVLIQFGNCDSIRIRNVHIAGTTSGSSSTAISLQTPSSNTSWPADNIVEDIDFGNLVAEGGSSVAKHGSGYANGNQPIIIRNIGHTNGATPNPANVAGGMTNLVWDAPGQPTGAISGSPITFTTATAWTNNFGVPVTIYYLTGTLSAVSIGAGAANLLGPWRVPVNQTITFTGTGTITGDVIGD